MKKNHLKKVAFLGLSAGALMTNQSTLEADAINLDYVLAKPACKASAGCGGLTAAREVENTKYDIQNSDTDTDTDPDSEQKRFDEEVKKNV